MSLMPSKDDCDAHFPIPFAKDLLFSIYFLLLADPDAPFDMGRTREQDAPISCRILKSLCS